MKRKKYKIVNKKRFFISVFIIALLVISLVSLIVNVKEAYSSTYKQEYKEVIVKAGDTLWKIAKEHMPKDYDIRKMVYEIRKINHLESADIYPGDLVKVPIVR
ncbi:MAG: LysM peptidoglycan-binding domain-containing protein [Tissierellales bacterium]|jgi:LysM repeat protein